MMNEFQNNLQNVEFQQKQIIMMGGDIKKSQKKQLSPQEIDKFKKDLVGMYYGFTSINWGNGMTLGMAWQKALEQMDGFAMSKLKIINHPANEHLMKFYREFRRNTAKNIMTSKYADEKLPERLKKSFVDYGQKRVKETKSDIDKLYQKYMPEKEIKHEQDVVKFDLAKKRTKQMTLQLLMQQQRA